MTPLRYPSVLLAIVLLLAGCQDGPSGECRMGRMADVPLQLSDGHLIVDTALNGVPTRMVLDTGADETTITSEAADRLHLPLERYGRATGIGGVQTGYRFVARTFQIGWLFGHHLSLYASDMGSGHGGFEDGLFGDDFLTAYDLDLDLPEHKAILYTRMKGCSSPSAYLSGPLYGLGMVTSGDGHAPRVRVEIGGKTLIATVDSGASHTVILRDAAERLGLHMADMKTDTHFKVGGIGPYTRDAVRHVLTSVGVGDLTIRNMPVAIVDQDSLDDSEMLLGLDFLVRVHVWFSFSSHTMIMQYPPKPSPSL